MRRKSVYSKPTFG